MTTYREQFQKAVAGETIPPFWLGYFREEHREALNEQLIELMTAAAMSKAELARKVGRRPEQVTRWINSPSNLEADTVSDLALAFGYRPKVSWEPIAFEASSRASPSDSGSTGNVISLEEYTSAKKAGGASKYLDLGISLGSGQSVASVGQ